MGLHISYIIIYPTVTVLIRKKKPRSLNGTVTDDSYVSCDSYTLYDSYHVYDRSIRWLQRINTSSCKIGVVTESWT